MKRLLQIASLLAGCALAQAENVIEYDVVSPNEHLRLALAVSVEGIASYQIMAGDRTLILPSRLGLIANRNGYNATDWISGLKIVATDRRSIDTTWRTKWGERSIIPDHYNELRIDLQHIGLDHGILQLQVRAYDEGIAFRYVFPESLKTQILEFSGEQTEFNLPAGTQGFWTPAAQRFYEKRPIENWPSDCELPLTLELPDHHWLSIAEARQTNFARIRLRVVGSERLSAQLYGDVAETSPFEGPWRVVLVADKPGELLEHNYIIQNLNPPSEIVDPSWIHPGRVMREVTLSTAGAKRLTDFAVEQNIDYIEFDAGWYGYEYEVASDATQVKVDPRRNPRGDLNLAEAIRYAKSRGRRVLLYVNHRALERQLEKILPLYERWGVDGIKFGFVNTGSQHWTVWLHEAIKSAARHHLVVDVHDNYRPTGFSRTYPNLLQQEGIAGDEEFPTATQNTIYPFTRFIAGAADHTYCFLDQRLKTTKAHQLALAAVNFGPLQFLSWYDRPEAYTDRSEIEFWKDLPTVWDETRVLEGIPGEYITTARRKGTDWWVGAITNIEARNLSVPLGFLGAGAAYAAEIYEDTPNHGIAKHTLVVTRDSTLKCAVRASGGVAIRLRVQP